MQTRRWMMGLALAIVAAGPVHAMHQDTTTYQCKANDQIIFQDHPCAGAVAIAPQSPANPHVIDEAALERKLDHLQVLGVGLIQPGPPSAQQPPPKVEPLYPDGVRPRGRMSRAEYRHLNELWSERLSAQAEHNNAVASAALSRDEGQMQQRCDGKVSDLPSVGMSDEVFRQCTTLARYGHINQIVASDDNGIPLRLYVFPTEKIRRVYSIDGVVTAVKP